ncbi:hypothetical protein [Cognatilysobacter terrigena]|uniref:hypothetical protein n=1 Tax=Cognatilysobacter terrigena TaxID=2488749 RepID=UPI001414DEC9|nr:hypothetical protein [Lysobacter terrigena]
MCRSEFLKTLATMLAGAHTAGPVSLAGWPVQARRRRDSEDVERRRAPRPAARPATCS